MAAFSLRLDLAMEVNRHYFENEYSLLRSRFLGCHAMLPPKKPRKRVWRPIIFFCSFELSGKFLYAK